MTERKQQARTLLMAIQTLDLEADLKRHLAYKVISGPISDCMNQRNLMTLVPEFMRLIHTIAHKGPMDYDGHTREHSKSDSETGS